eukprot:Polyplicarium_translucidae@DN3342_c1_g2_i2.p2
MSIGEHHKIWASLARRIPSRRVVVHLGHRLTTPTWHACMALNIAQGVTRYHTACTAWDTVPYRKHTIGTRYHTASTPLGHGTIPQAHHWDTVPYRKHTIGTRYHTACTPLGHGIIPHWTCMQRTEHADAIHAHHDSTRPSHVIAPD